MLLGDIFDVFRKGKSLANAAAWKNRAVASDLVAGLLASGLAVSAAFGYRLDLDADTLQALAGGVAAVGYLLSAGVHIATSEKVGLPAKPESDAGGRQPAVGELGEQPDYRG